LEPFAPAGILLSGLIVKATLVRLLSPSDIYVVVAAFNEATVISRVVNDISRAGYTVVVVDDGSRDETADLTRTLDAVVISHPFNLGQGAALQTGIHYARSKGARFVVTFDGDGQHRVADISRLLEPLIEGQADFVLGSRFLKNESKLPSLRRLMLRAAILFTRLTTGMTVSDTHNGLRAMTLRGACAINLRQNRMAHASEFLNQIRASGLSYVECPVRIDYTAYSVEKGQRMRDALLILLDLFAGALQR
jgi:glycosyltransferase involved in cell wall biosynthesis